MRSFVLLLWLFLSIAASGSADIPSKEMDAIHAAFKAEEFQSAYDIALPYAEDGDPVAQYALGLALMGLVDIGYWDAFVLGATNEHVSPLTEEAEKWWLLAAEGGVANAQYALGFHYSADEGLFPTHYGNAIGWLEKAIEQNYDAEGMISASQLLQEARANQRRHGDVPSQSQGAVPWDLVIFIVLLVLGYLIGSWKERRHLRSLARREAEMVHVPFVNDHPEMFRSAEGSDLVYGSVVIASDRFKSFLYGLRNIFGGNVSAFETMLDRGRREALLRMRAMAPKARAVANVRIETALIKKHSVEVCAYGTALY